MTRPVVSIVLSTFALLACTTAISASERPADAPKPPASAPVASAEPAPPIAVTAVPSAPPAPPPEIPKGTAVLHVGDSFTLAGFAQALKPRMKALGVRYEVRAETSSFTTTWSSKMENLVANTQPDLVLINLGANEVANTDPSAHAPAVRRIVSAIGNRPCVWISPPSWRKDTGIVDVIRQNSAPCRFFDSDKLVTQPIPRQSDKIHPTEQGGAIWADAFWGWLQEQRAPADTKGKRSPWLLRPAPPEEHQPQGR
jgi:lysophospholipase L1-like esterase